MNIQIFGTKKCNDTKKAERFFKEHGQKRVHEFFAMKPEEAYDVLEAMAELNIK